MGYLRKQAEELRRHGARHISPVKGVVTVFAFAIPLVLFLLFEIAPETAAPRVAGGPPGDAAVRAELHPPGSYLRRPVSIPDFVKGIYVSSSTAGSPIRFGELVDLVDTTELNAMVIDVKDHRGAIAFLPRTEGLVPYAAENPPLGDLQAFTAPLRDKGIYLIARLFVFQDPAYVSAHPEVAVQRAGGAVWRDYRGVSWLDPASKQVWKYNAAIAKDAFAGGFDEVQFDYIRFPSDGNLRSMVFPVWDGKEPKQEVMLGFFTFLDKELRVRHGIPISVDLFGLTMWQHETDLNIGQRLAHAVPHFDFISPMVYPSHYPEGFNGYPNPATRPYDVIFLNLQRGQAVFDAARDAAGGEGEQAIGTVRPWLQDFDLGANYDGPMVRAQMRAAEDAGATGWLLWNAGNVYTRSALDGPEDG